MNIFKSLSDISAEATERKPFPVEGEKRESAPFFNPEAKEPEKPKLAETTKSAEGQIKKLSPEEAKKAGQVNAYMLSGGVEFLLTAVEMIRHTRTLSDDEKQILIGSRTKEKTNWTPKEKTLNQKFLALSEKHEKIKEKIKTTDEEKQILEYGFSLYAEVTGKQSTPGVIIGGMLARYLGTKLLDIFM